MNPPDLGETYHMALQCYRKLEARLSRNPETARLYNDFLTEYRDLGHMTPDENFTDDPKTRYFLPYHPVIRESSTTTKLRVVFNASAKSTNGNSLNDCMHVGPKLQTNVTDVLLRWRMYRYVLSADIEKMFRQIQVASDDTPFQCILWKPPNANNIQVFRLSTGTYGTAAAPYLSMRVLQQLADNESKRFPNASVKLKRDVYVDDTLFGHDSLENCRVLRDALITLLRSGGFSLRKFQSNCEELLDDLTSDLRARDLKKTFDASASTKVLGIHWQPKDDRFIFQVKPDENVLITKRTVLSCIASIFDPLCWISPTLIIAKTFMQTLWRNTLDWDTPPCDTLKQQWLEFRKNLLDLEKISIPRWSGATNNSEWELHGFSDASMHAYGAVIYLKYQTDGNIIINLLTSKTCVTPIKEVTIPRLELCAAVLLAELMAHVQTILQREDILTFCWSDSRIVLSWLNADPSKWKRFVANRVSQIQEALPFVDWNYVPSEQNPADLASRGVTADELRDNNLWWHGPDWLRLPRSA